MQLSFYFVNPSLTDDGRYLWFYCVYPPGGRNAYGWQLGVVDFEADTIRVYPETMFQDASPYVDLATGDAYWTTGLEIWRRGPRSTDIAQRVGAFPADVANNRRPRRIATHLTRSADGKSFAIDAEFSPDWYVGDIPVDGSSPARIWQQFDRCYNHAQFSPTDPNTILVAQDGWFDSATGEKGEGEDRLWLLTRGGEARPLCPDAPAASNRRGHEWWDADGEHVWYIDYRNGTERVNIHTGVRETIWANGHTHSHCDRAGRYLVGDTFTPPGHWAMAFYNIATGREIAIVTEFPVYNGACGCSSLPATTAGYDATQYHVHPHPQFCNGDRMIAYTTNVRGSIDVALVDVEQLVALTS
jgi:hypothetical protein